jgi:hypothetical protein
MLPSLLLLLLSQQKYLGGTLPVIGGYMGGTFILHLGGPKQNSLIGPFQKFILDRQG